MRTEEQKAFLWKAVDLQREAYFTRAYDLFLSALNKQVANAIIAVEEGRDVAGAIQERPIREALVQVYETVGVAFAKEQFSALKSHEADYQTKAAAEESVWLTFMRRFALEKAGERIKAITETTLGKVRSVLEFAVGEGLSIPNTVKLLKDEFNGINKTRATVIARTEIISSSSRGSVLGARSTGLPLNKIWLSTRDKRTRSSHISVDDQRVDIDGLFEVNGAKLDHPGDYTNGAPASETVQCRCTVIYESK